MKKLKYISPERRCKELLNEVKDLKFTVNQKNQRIDNLERLMDLEVASHNKSLEDKNKIEKEVNSRREQITDINQWSHLLLSNRGVVRPRIMWSMIADINNRTTD